MTQKRKLAHTNGNITKVQLPYDYTGPLQSRNYILSNDEYGDLQLEDFSEFDLPKKLYGDDLDYLTNKVLHSFHNFGKNVGILLSGLKGTGKSVQLKHLAINSNFPVIVVNTPYDGTLLLPFFESLPNSCLILFDEFEKVYNTQELQHSVLPLFDGVSTTPHIYALSVNGEVSEFLMGRPGRVRYRKHYDTLGFDIVKEVVNDIVSTKRRAAEVVSFLEIFPTLSMDVVTSFASEANLYKEETIGEIAKTFNIDDPFDHEYEILFEMSVITAKDETFVQIQDTLYDANYDPHYKESVYGNAEEKKEWLERTKKALAHLGVTKMGASIKTLCLKASIPNLRKTLHNFERTGHISISCERVYSSEASNQIRYSDRIICEDVFYLFEANLTTLNGFEFSNSGNRVVLLKNGKPIAKVEPKPHRYYSAF